MNKMIRLITCSAILCFTHAATAQMTMTFSTVQPGGKYRPKNIVAVWVETSNGTFVKTINRYAGTRANDMSQWRAASGGRSVDSDAVMGATRPNHSAPTTITAEWDFTNRAGTEMPDGDYVIKMNMDDGSEKFYSFPFTKDQNAGTRTAAGTTWFQNISISYSPPAPPDVDNDGLPDPWEEANGLTVGVDDSQQDSDGDGLSNYGEYVAGTNPQQASSVFALTPPMLTSPTDLSLEWSSVSGKTYTVEYSSSLTNATGWIALGSSIPATPPTNSTNAPVNEGARFYRISVEP